MPETRRERARKVVAGNKTVYWGIAIGIIVLVLNIIMSAYATSLNEQLAATHGQLRLQEDSRDKDAEDQLQAVQRQSLLMTQLLRNHLYWSQALDRIEDLMQSNVVLTVLDATFTGGEIQFQARGTNYAAVARQLASLNTGAGINEVELTNVEAKPEGGVEFIGTITIDVSDVIRRQAVPAVTNEE